MATAWAPGPSGSKTHSSAFVRLLNCFVLVTILPPVGARGVGEALELERRQDVGEHAVAVALDRRASKTS
jgi:hypothetical protein